MNKDADPDAPALAAIADLIVANPGMTFDEAARTVVRDKPHLIAPTPQERRRPN